MEIMKYKCSYEDNLKNIADPIVHKMLERQVEQGNPRDVSVFEENRNFDKASGGFNWADSPEGTDFWLDVLLRLNFCIFFEKYPELRPYEVGEGIDELKDMLHRIEAKLDQLLATPADADDKQEKPDEQDVEINPGDHRAVNLEKYDTYCRCLRKFSLSLPTYL